MKTAYFFIRQCVCRPLRTYASPKQGFARVYIADARYSPLIEQGVFDWCSKPAENRAHPFRCETPAQRFRPQSRVVRRPLFRRKEIEPPKPPYVVVKESGSVVENEVDSGMPKVGVRRPHLAECEPSRHAQLRPQQHAIGCVVVDELEEEKLGAPLHPFKCPVVDLFPKIRRCQT